MHNAGIEHQLVARAPKSAEGFLKLRFRQVIFGRSYGIVGRNRHRHQDIEAKPLLQFFGSISDVRKGQVLGPTPRLKHPGLANPTRSRRAQPRQRQIRRQRLKLAGTAGAREIFIVSKDGNRCQR